jgi:hypothetical protein
MKATNNIRETIKSTVVYSGTFTLEMEREEAQFLADILAKIGGDPDTSRRDIADRFAKALYENGFHFDTSDLDGSITVLNRKETS